MSAQDKIQNNLDKASGVAKEKVGELRDDEDQQAEGKVDQIKADLKQAGEKVKDALS